MSYAELTLVVAGVAEEQETFTDYLLLEEYERKVSEEAESHGYPSELYRLDHEHDLGPECECHQFAQDHKPWRTYNHKEDAA